MADASTAKAAAAPSESAPAMSTAAGGAKRKYIVVALFIALLVAVAVGLGVGLGLTANNPRVGFTARATVYMPMNMVRWRARARGLRAVAPQRRKTNGRLLRARRLRAPAPPGF